MEMPPPKNISQLRSLQGRLQSIKQFITQLVDKCLPFNHLLHKNIPFRWEDKCVKSFHQLKQYLMNPPVLVPPIVGNPLILYILLGALLAQEDPSRKERAIYYINSTLNIYELNYTFITKACLAVVFASQKFCHYMLAHTIKLVAKIDPLKYLLSKETLIGRLAKWVMILSEFDIQYTEHWAIKGQVIENQLTEAPLPDHQPLQVEFTDMDVLIVTPKQWTLYFDGSYTQHGSGVGILFVTLEGHTILRYYRLMFPCTNNIAKYEALVTGIKMAVEWRITKLRVYGDSQLVINLINEDYQTKDNKLMP